VPTIREQALALIPAANTSSAALARIHALQQAIPFESEQRRAAAALVDVVARYARGEDVDVAAAAAAVPAAMNTDQANQTLRMALQDEAASHGDALRPESGRLTVEQQQPAIDLLADALSTIILGVTQLEPALTGVRDANEAIRAGAADEWATLDTLVAQYDEVRAVQHHLYTNTVGVDDANANLWMVTVGLFADALEHEEFWVERRMQSARNSPNTYSNEQAWKDWLSAVTYPAPWPSAETQGWWPTPDRHAYLRWIAASAHPWVPALSIARQVYESARPATSPTRGNGITTHLEAARATYQQLTER
jgi:hypothetical protein